MKRVQLEAGYILSQRPYRETSALLEVFTGEHGRVGLVARGMRGAKSRQRGLLQPFRRLLLSWSEGGELGTLTGVEAAEAAMLFEGEAVFSGWYLNELLLRVLQRRDPHPALFARYAGALAALATPQARRALRLFEKHLLAEMGYGLQLPQALTADAWYVYDPETGPRPAARPGGEAYRGASLLALAAEEFASDESLRDAQRLLREALTPHLGSRELQTPRMLRALRAAGGAGAR